MKSWFDIKAKSNATANQPDAEVLIYDDIGAWGITAKDFISAVQASGSKRPLVRINSRGGSVFDGIAIHSYLSGLDATVQVDGIAASIASIIALAGKRVNIASNGYFMVHNPMALADGNAEALRTTADILDKLAGTLAEMYAKKTGKGIDTVKGWMDAETWFTAQEAVDAGLASSISDSVSFSACVTGFSKAPSALTQTPQAAAANHNSNTAPTMKKLLAALAQAGLISSAESGEDTAVAEFTTRFEAQKTEAKANADELGKLRASAAEQAKVTATAQVDAAIADGRIKAEQKDAWIAAIVADLKTATTLLAGINKPVANRTGGTPMAANVGTDATGKKLTLTEQVRAEQEAAAQARR